MGLKSMKIYIKVISTVLLMTIGASVWAGSVWDGSVSTARYGYLPQSGLYAASNAFPHNTLVTVTNPETGKTVDVTVLERLEDNTVFLALSADAADAIGISYGDIFYGQISEQDKISGVNEKDLPYNPDPDINPSAASEDYTELAIIQNYIDKELGGTDNTILNNSGVDKPVENTTVSDTPEPETVEVTENMSTEEDIPKVESIPMEDTYISTPKETLPSPDVPDKNKSAVSIVKHEEDIPIQVGMDASAPILVPLADPAAVLPELPVPESDKPVISLLSVEPTEKTDQQSNIEILPELPIIGIEDSVEETPLAVNLLYDVAPVEEDDDIMPSLPLISEKDQSVDTPEITSVDAPAPVIESDTKLAETLPSIVSPEEVEVILKPSEARPPVVKESATKNTVVEVPSIPASTVSKPVAEPVTAEIPEVDNVAETVKESEVVSVKDNSLNSYNITKVLSKNSYYLQLGVYREEYSALALAGSLGSTYPVTVLISESTDTPRYKVMVGPLGADESGVMLYRFKSSGYPDAFLRKGL